MKSKSGLKSDKLKSMKPSKITLLVLISCLLAAFFIFDTAQYLNLENLKARQADIVAYKQAHEMQAVVLYFVTYVILISLPLPVGAVLTVTGGALFGLWWGTLLVSFASTIGSTLSFLAARFLFRDAIQNKFSDYLVTINKGIETDGAFYLFTLRLVPVFPPFVINPLLGLTPIRTATFFFVSQLGMLAGTMVYVNAGTQLARISALEDILSVELFAAFALLGIFPLLAKKSIAFIKKTLTTTD